MRLIKSEKMGRTASYYISYIALGLAAAVLGPTLPSLAEQTQSQLSQISFLFTAHSLGYLIGSYQGGRLYDRMPGHPVMVVAVFLMAIMLLFVPVVPSVWLLALVIVVVGLAGSTLDVGGNVLLVWVHGRDVGPFMNGLHFFFGLGAFLSPIIVAQAISLTNGISWAYWALALIMVPGGILLLRWSSPQAPGPASQPGEGSSAEDQAAGASKRETLTVVFVALFLLLNVGAELGFGGWVYTYALAMNLGTVTTAAYLTSIFWGALTVGRLISIPLALRFRPRTVLLWDMIGCLVSMVILLAGSESWLATSIGAAGLGLSMASVFPTTISLAERRVTVTGRVTGWFVIGASLGSMFLPWLIGQLFDSAGPEVAMIIIMIDLVLALAVFGILILYSRPKPFASAVST
jgi:FHS family Na+ dependent glucose MFS transporter 1